MTLTLESLLRLGGFLQLAVLTAAALVPKVLDWKRSLAPLSEFLRKMFWVYGAFIAMTIIAFGTLSVAHAGALADGSPLARSVCAVIAVFWGARLLIQIFVFDIRPLKVHALLQVGYHGLTAVFTYLAAIFGYAALVG